jgi:hypothetical protein
VLSDGRFAILGGNGVTNNGNGSVLLSSCLTLSTHGGHWVLPTPSMPAMFDSRASFACAAVAGCVIVAGGNTRRSAEVYDESVRRWFRLPCDLPYETHGWMGSALL